MTETRKLTFEPGCTVYNIITIIKLPTKLADLCELPLILSCIIKLLTLPLT